MFAFFVLFTFCLISCEVAGPSAVTQYSSNDVGVAMVSELGTIVQRRSVTISGGTSRTRRGKRLTGVGTGIGAVGGAALGAAVSKNTGAGAIAGGLIGGMLGTVAEAAHSQQSSQSGTNGFEYTVKLSKSGQILTVVQPADIDISVGQNVVVFRNVQTNTIRLEPTAYIG